MTLTSSNFSPIIFLLDCFTSQIRFIEPSYINVFLWQTSSDRSFTKNLSLKHCTDNDLKEFQTNSSFFPNSSCFNDSFEISDNSVLELFVVKCANSSESSIICKSNEEIDEFMKTKVLVFSYAIFRFQPGNIEQPFNRIFKSLSATLNKDQADFQVLEILPIDFQDSSNAFWDDTKQKFYHEDNINPLISKHFDNVPMYYYLRISMNKIQKTIIRKFEKISATLGKIGGLASILHACFSIFAQIELHLKILNLTIKKLFSSQKLEKNNFSKSFKKINLEKNKEIEICNNNNNGVNHNLNEEKGEVPQSPNIFISEKDLKKLTNDRNKKNYEKNNSFQIKMGEYILYLFKKISCWRFKNNEKIIDWYEEE